MSIRSTYYISRSLAIEILLSNLDKVGNTELAEMLEELPQSEYRNYIVSDYDMSDAWNSIKTIEEFEEAQ